MRARLIPMLAILLLTTGGAWAAPQPDSSMAFWAQKHLWAGDSIALTDSGFTFEIHRDMSDLFHWAKRGAPSDFGLMLQLHGFLYLASPLSSSLFESHPKIERIRLVLWAREKSSHEPMVKLRLNRTNILSSHPEVISTSAPEDPERFIKICRKRFDGFWASKGLGE